MRGTTAARGYDGAWQKLRRAFLMEHPFCQCDECDEGRKRLRLATVVHHKIEISKRPDLRLCWENLQSLAKPCHDKHTAGQSRSV